MSKRRKGKTAIIVLIIGALIVCGILFYGQRELQKELREIQFRIDETDKKIEAEEEKTKELETERIYRETEDYIEDKARELGLVYPDEVVIKPGE